MKRAGTRFCSTRCRVAAHRARRRQQERPSCPLPAAMVEARRWVNHDAAKVPLDPRTGRRASVSDPATWGTYQQATARNDRLGYVLGEGIGCIDLDHCLDEQGRPTQAAADLVEFYAGSYIEVSPSGRGLHIWGTAPERSGFRRTWKGQAVEFYSRGRYITITGRVFRPGTLLPL